jgi:hypothetical protein
MIGVRNVSLVKERSSPAVHLLVGDTKFWITSPEELATLGFDWPRVKVVDDGALAGFREDRLHAPPTARPSDVFFDCGADFDSIGGRYRWNCCTTASLIRREVLVAGWLYTAPYVNEVGGAVEDVHFNLRLDVLFLERMYGPNGLSTTLRGAAYPGNPPAPTPLPFADAGVVNFNSWILPGNDYDLHGELNAWHQNTTGGLFTYHWIGRGNPPAYWRNPLFQDTDAWFPFSPLDPGGTGTPLRQDDYVVMRGPLWQDQIHYASPTDPHTGWDSGRTTNHGAWLEMHPIDWIVRVRGPGPNSRITTARMAQCVPPDGGVWAQTVTAGFAPSSPTRRLEVRSLRGSVDNRMTDLTGWPAISVNRVAGQVELAVTVQPAQGRQERFKVSWLVGWRELDQYDRIWVDDALPAGAVGFGDAEGWSWTSTDPEPYIGALAHRSGSVPGMHQHFFDAATPPMQVGAGDRLFAMVYLDPDDPPDEVMLQWKSGDWSHRAYWGADMVNWGIPGTAQRVRMGPLPPTGEWVRLEVPAAAVELEGRAVTGMAFTLWNGRASWDYAGDRVAVPNSGVLRLQASPSSVAEGNRSIIVLATDSGTGVRVSGRVLIDGADVAATNTAFMHEFELGGGSVAVRCPGYPEARTRISVRPALDP